MKVWHYPNGVIVTEYDIEVVRQWAQGSLDVIGAMSKDDPDPLDEVLSGYFGAMLADKHSETIRACVAAGRKALSDRGDVVIQIEPDDREG